MSKQRPAADQSLCCAPLLRAPLTEPQSVELSRVFKAIADPVRLRLLSLIASHAGGEACVCDLTDAFDLTGPTISHHLKVLREAGVIDGERRGTWIYYRVLPDTLRTLSAVLVTPELVTPEVVTAGWRPRASNAAGPPPTTCAPTDNGTDAGALRPGRH